MCNKLRSRLTAFLPFATVLLAASPASAAWQNNFSGFGATLQGDLYTPSTLASPPAVLVAIHMCTGHASTVHGWFDSFADKNGFYIIAPDAGKQCFDSGATRDGDKAAIVKMVDYLVTQKGADKSRVFAAGMSSGGCMTNTLLGIYPDVFAGGSAMPGFTAGGWPGGDTTCTKCSTSPPNSDGKYWGDIARKVFAWSGKYPCSQQWVGGGDEYNFNGWLPAVTAQFQNLSGLDAGASGTGAPSGWTRKVYKDKDGNVWLETNLGPTSQKHDLENLGATLYGNVVSFLGLDKPNSVCGVAPAGSGSGGAGGGGVSTGTGGGAAGGRSGGGGATPTGGRGGGTGGGTITGSGGGTSTGGASGSGGAPGSGGTSTPGSGGLSASSGGIQGSGGIAASSGGKTGSGGASSQGSGGVQSSGGSTGSNGSGGSGGPNQNGDSNGCSVAGGGGRSAAATAMLLIASLGLVLRRRKRTTR